MYPILRRDEVHSWCVALDARTETSASLYATLSPDERDRSTRFRFERDRRRFVIAHAALRDLLGRYLGTRPGQIRFVYNAFGKPELSPEFGSRLKFNLSHSADLALIALALDTGVGVDVEYVQADADYAEIARHFFPAAEVDHLNTVPCQLRSEAFLRCWTRKEACAKAGGEGLATLGRRGAWSIYGLRPAPGYIGALAIEPGDWRLKEWHWRC